MKNIRKSLAQYINLEDENQLFGFKWLLFASIVLYCQQAWVPGFFMDGYLYAAFGKNAAELGHWLVPFQSESQYPRFDQHPPLFFILEGLFFKLFGSGFTSARLFGAGFGVLCTLFLYQLLRKNDEKKWAYFTVLVFLLLPSFMKKVRFPNMDIPLTLCFILAYSNYFKAYKNNLNFSWILSGLFFGIALLIKGPPAFAIPLGIFIHLILTKRLSIHLKNIWSWLGLLFGLIVFSVWPLALYMTDNFDIFQNYLNKQLFFTIVEGRGESTNNYFLYLIHIFKTAPIWAFMAIWGGWVYFKEERKNELYLLGLSWFLALFIPFSFVTFKYSHYLLPAFPAFAIIAAYPFLKFNFKTQQWIHWGFSKLIIFASLILLIFPLTTKSKRHVELLEVSKSLKKIDYKPKNWVLIGNAYEYWSLSNYSSYIYQANPRRENSDYIENILRKGNQKIFEKQIIFVKKDYFKSLINSYPHWGESLSILDIFEKRNLIILIDKNSIKQRL